MPTNNPPPPDAQPDPVGIACPRCGCRHLLAGYPKEFAWFIRKTERRPGYIRRRRVCRNCGAVVYTREAVETPPTPAKAR